MTTKKKKREALGKGIRALLQDIEKDTKATNAFSDEDIQEDEKVKEEAQPVGINTIPIEKIEVNPFQPRVDFDETALQELSESISVHGVIQPITVRQLENGNYQLISGERRTRASKLAGLTEIPAYIREATNDQEMLEMALIENIQRENLNALEVAVNYQRLLEECKLTQEQLAVRVGKSRSSITNFLRLLKLSPGVQSALKSGGISMGHGRALLSLNDFDLQDEFCIKIMEKDLSVRETEQMVKAHKEPAKAKKEKTEISAEWVEFKNIISQKIGGAATSIRNKGKGKGEIVIAFKDEDELNKIIELLDK